jgi:CheY-like chemotaxis protein
MATVKQRCRVLVVDDDADVRESTADVIRLLGHEVVTACDGRSALDEGHSFAPELVLLDVGLPGTDGHEVARRIRNEPWGRRTLLAAMTGWVQDSDRAATAAAGFDMHLSKPVPLTTLRDVLARASRALPSVDA